MTDQVEHKGLLLFENGKQADVEIVRDHLTREIIGGGDPFIGFAQRMRDRGFKNGILDEFYLYDRVLDPAEITILSGLQKQTDDGGNIAIFNHSAYPPSVKARERLYTERESFGDQRQRLTEIMVMEEMPGERETHILDRGHYENRGKIVKRETPEVLTPFPKGAPNNRMGLAKWLTAQIIPPCPCHS